MAKQAIALLISLEGSIGIYQGEECGQVETVLERDEITSGTTWHSAAQVTSFGMNQTMVALKRHSIALYRDLAADPDHPVGYNYGDGGIRLAAPLSPALHLGARRVLAISTRYDRSQAEADRPAVTGYPPPAQIAGVLMMISPSSL